ncbi:MAG: PRC-barrel domain-containing protein [Erysipelotrichaceae bacterium]
MGEIMRLSELSEKQVVNINSGEIIGMVRDCDLNYHDYCVEAFIVIKKEKGFHKLFPWFFQSVEICIKIDHIESIGEDVILIR